MDNGNNKSIVRDIFRGIGDVVGTVAVAEFFGAMFGVRMPIGRYIASKHQEKVNEQKIRYAQLKCAVQRPADDDNGNVPVTEEES